MNAACPLCEHPAPEAVLAEAGWQPAEVVGALVAQHPGWRRADGACPACVQQALLETLLARGEAEFHAGLQSRWPLDAEAAFGAIPTPLRLHADPRVSGRGVCVALVDSGFHPHADLTTPTNRIAAWVDARSEAVEVRRFATDEVPRWPGWDAGADVQWHGLMTSAVVAGNGALGHGLYRGLAPEARLVLVAVADERGRIGNAAIVRALRWLGAHAAELGVGVVNLSLGGEPTDPLAGNPVDAAVEALVAAGVFVVAAAGNDGERRLVPPGTCPRTLTVGGLDDRNTLDDADRAVWHGNYGESPLGAPKPELVAPSLWVVAPLLPGTAAAREAAALFARRAHGDPGVEAELAARKLVTPHYQHVEGTSFAAPIVAGIAAGMLEANPELGPRRLAELLVAAARPVPGAPGERQGAGAVEAGRAVALARADRHSDVADFDASPLLTPQAVRFRLHDHEAGAVELRGSWSGWQAGEPARRLEDGVWEAELPPLPAGRYAYKFLLDGRRWLADPANPRRAHDGFGGLHSVFEVGAP